MWLTELEHNLVNADGIDALNRAYGYQTMPAYRPLALMV